MNAIGSNLHPVFQQALKPFTTQPVQGFQRCAHTAPRPEKGTQRFEYTLGDVDLSCDMEYEPACRGSRERGTGLQMEPDEPESVTLCAAYVRDVDISELLDDDQRAEIEEAFLTQDRDD